MRIAFITPSLHTLRADWKTTPLLPELAVPSISGYLFSQGYDDLRHYEFGLEVFDLERREPGRLDLAAYFDDDRVDGFLRGDDDDVRATTELVLETLGVALADVFGLSCTAAPQRYDEIHALANVSLCLAKVLKERYPGCATVIGGLNISPEEHSRRECLAALERCRDLDFAVHHLGEAPMLHIVEHLAGVASFRRNRQEVEACGAGTFLHENTSLRTGQSSWRPKGARESRPAVRLSRMMQRPRGRRHDEDSRTFLFVTPWFDPRVVERQRANATELAGRYHLPVAIGERLLARGREPSVILPMIFMQGCNGRCAFCTNSGSTLVSRHPREVVRAIAWLRETYGVRYFQFFNTNINGHREYAETFCDELAAARLDILWSDSLNLRVLDERLLDRMCATGLWRAAVGLEAPCDRLLRFIHKGIDTATATDRLRLLHERGVWTHIQFIAGMPGETEEDRRQMVAFIERTAETSDAYTVSPFYIDFRSVMGRYPERYGIRLAHDAGARMQDGAFDEVGGLSWPEKKRQIESSTKLFYETIARCRGVRRVAPGLDLDLLFWLYDCLGHEAKADIVAAWEASSFGEAGEAVAKPIPQAAQGIYERLRETGDGRRFGEMSLADLRAGAPGELHIELRGGGEELEIVIAPLADTPRHFDHAGPLALSHAEATPVDSPVRKAAFEALKRFLAE